MTVIEGNHQLSLEVLNRLTDVFDPQKEQSTSGTEGEAGDIAIDCQTETWG